MLQKHAIIYSDGNQCEIQMELLSVNPNSTEQLLVNANYFFQI